MKKYSIKEFRNYLETQDSFGDIFYNLSEESIDDANNPECLVEDCDHRTTIEQEYCDACLLELKAEQRVV